MAFLIANNTIPFTDLDQLRELAVVYPYVDDLLAFVNDWFDESQGFIQVITSGSTGKPSLISLSKSAMLSSAKKTEAYFGYKPGDLALCALPLKYIAGKMMVVRAMTTNLDLVVTKASSHIFTQNPSDVSLAFVPMTPHQFLVSYNSNPTCFDVVTKILLGGGPITNQVITIADRISSSVYLGFGMTETITHIAVRQLGIARPKEYEALDGVSFAVDNEDRLIISADHLGDKIFTNDVVKLISSQKFVWLSRYDNVIISGGVKLYPEIIEDKLASVLSKPFFLHPQDDPTYGQRPVLYIESDIPISNYLMEQVEKRLDKFEIPSLVIPISKFLRTETGKIKRKQTVASHFANK